MIGPSKEHDDFPVFIAGGDLDEFSSIHKYRARARLVPVVETFIESRHKDIKVESKQKHRFGEARWGGQIAS